MKYFRIFKNSFSFNTLAVVLSLSFLLIQFVVQLRLSALDSQTTDEAVHLSSGYTYVTRGDFRFNPEHPTFVKLLSGVAVSLINPTISPKAEKEWASSSNFFYDSWRNNRTFGIDLMYSSENNPNQLLYYARYPIVILTLILGLTIFGIAYREWGPLAALVATSLFAFDPTVNAHGHLVTTDIAAALGFVLSTYALLLFARSASFKNAVFVGLALGLAMISKFTLILLFPFVIFVFAYLLYKEKNGKLRLSLILRNILSLACIWVVIWASYGFSTSIAPATDNISQSQYEANTAVGVPTDTSAPPIANTAANFAYKLGRVLLLPKEYVKGMLLVTTHASGGHDAFLLGQKSNHGWWYYFPVVAATKLPVVTILLIFCSWYLAYKHRSKLVRGFLLSAGLFFLGAMVAKANLGLRHVLPAVVVFVLIAGWSLTKVKHGLILGIIAICLMLANYFYVFPTYLGYYNQLAGGLDNGHNIATDSNIDWGQDMHRIKDYLVKNDIQGTIYFEYGWNGIESLDYYFPEYERKQLYEWKAGSTGYAIVGASALSTTTQTEIKNCPEGDWITNGAYICKLSSIK